MATYKLYPRIALPVVDKKCYYVIVLLTLILKLIPIMILEASAQIISSVENKIQFPKFAFPLCKASPPHKRASTRKTRVTALQLSKSGKKSFSSLKGIASC
jgi:hypothetical protein